MQGGRKADLLTKGGKQAVSLIPEGDLWRLIIRSKLPQAEAIEKWIMEDVLPSIRKTGTYSTNKSDPKQLEFYEYFDKTYKGNPVLSSKDIENLLNISNGTINFYVRKYLKKGTDYLLLEGNELAEYKFENPKVSKLASAITVITKSGFEKLCRYFGTTIETPKMFIEDKKPSLVKKQKEYALVLNNKAVQQSIEKIRKQLVAVDVLLTQFNRHNIEIENMNSLKKTIASLGIELGAELSGLAYEKLSTTSEYKY